jgi:hypothetical protein
MHQQRSPARFLIVSGTYLFVIILLNSMQPRSGYSADINIILILNLFFLPVWAAIVLIAIWCRKIKEKNGGKEIIQAKVLFWIIILSVIAGFLLNVDYQRQVGCFVDDEPYLSPVKFIISGMSITLLSLGYIFSTKKIGVVLLILEFIFWTLKALVYYTSSLDLIFTGYFTVICWALRLAFIMKFLVKDKAAASISV